MDTGISVGPPTAGKEKTAETQKEPPTAGKGRTSESQKRPPTAGKTEYSEAIVHMTLGIGDMVFVEVGIRKLLSYGVKVVHLFARSDGLKLYHDYPGVKLYPLEAKKALMDLRKRYPYVLIDDRTHPFYNPANRVNLFTNSIVTAFGLPKLTRYEPPVLPVSDENVEWAEMYANKRDGHPLIIWQMDASKAYKTLPIEKSLTAISRLSEDGCKVLALSSNQSVLPRIRNVKWIRGVSIERFMGLCAIADRVVAHDSAPAWIGAAVGAEVLAVFGPTNPRQYAIRSDNVKVLRWMVEERCYSCGAGCDDTRCLSELPDDVLYTAARDGELPSQERKTESTWEDYTRSAVILMAEGDPKAVAVTIESLLRQNCQNYELVIGEVMDSGIYESTLAAYAATDDRVRVIRMPGGTKARMRLKTLANYAACSSFCHSFTIEAGETWQPDELSRRLYRHLRAE